MEKIIGYLSAKAFLLFGQVMFSLIGLLSIQGDQAQVKYKTKYVIVIVMDGARYSETWGDSTHRYIPNISGEMAKEGIIFSNFYNDGYTYTSSGHTAICTGFKQELENSKGSQLPIYPSFFQYYLKNHPEDSSKAMVITTKDKLAILANCEDIGWNGHYMPKTDCGISGLGSGYREDGVTFTKVIEQLKTTKPHLLLVNFKEPDYSGHAGNWENYLSGIVHVDSMVFEIWKHIQSDPYYKNQTTLFVTNDHGRHTDGWQDGFISHGDGCDGCRHINLFAAGPDFNSNKVSANFYSQVDLTATIAELLGLNMPYVQGKAINDCFKKIDYIKAHQKNKQTKHLIFR